MLYLICDDNEKAAVSLGRRIRSLDPDCDMMTFYSAEALLFAVEDCRPAPDGVFMDIKLKGENGISVAERLLNLHPKLSLIYVTGYAQEYIQELYKVPLNKHPIAVLTKPINMKYLKNALDKIKEKAVATDYISIKSGSEMIYIDARNIIAVSSNTRKLTIESADGNNYEFYGKLSDFIKLLPKSFCQCHKSHIVNMEHITKIKGWNSVLMRNGSEYPVSRTYKENLKTVAVMQGG